MSTLKPPPGDLSAWEGTVHPEHGLVLFAPGADRSWADPGPDEPRPSVGEQHTRYQRMLACAHRKKSPGCCSGAVCGVPWLGGGGAAGATNSVSDLDCLRCPGTAPE